MGRTVIILKGCVLLMFATLPNFGQSTDLTVGDEFKFSCKYDGKSRYAIYPFSRAGESFYFSTLYPSINIKIKVQSFDNDNIMKCTTKEKDGKKLLNSTDVLVVPHIAGVEEFEPAVVQEHIFHENEKFLFVCEYFLVGWIKVDADNALTEGGTKNGLLKKKFTLTSDQFDGAKLICLQYECSESIGCDRSIQKVVMFRRYISTTTSTTSTTTVPTTTSTTLWTTNPPAANTTMLHTTANLPNENTTMWTTTNSPTRTTTTSAPTDSPTTDKPLPTTDKPLQKELNGLLGKCDLDINGNSGSKSKDDSGSKLAVHVDGDLVMFKFQGPAGPPGPAGAPGAPGAPGLPGLPGVCPVTCPVINLYNDSAIYPEGVEPGLGTEQHPAPAACRFTPATQQGPAPDPYWVMENEKFPVKCDRATNRTCLILSHDDARWIHETKLLVEPQASTWLSGSGFNLVHFNTITQGQLQWLKEQSVDVTQTIRVYLWNSTFARANLRVLSASDVVVGRCPTRETPLYYTALQHGDASITVNGEAWSYVDLVISDSVQRLPVVDFHVELEEQNPAYISVQLRELCFG